MFCIAVCSSWVVLFVFYSLLPVVLLCYVLLLVVHSLCFLCNSLSQCVLLDELHRDIVVLVEFLL